MRGLRPVPPVLLALVVVATSSAAGEGSWWDYVPFANRSESRVPLMNGKPLVGGSPGSPTLWDRVSSAPQRLGSGTMRVVRGTKDLILSPFADDEPQQPIWGQTRTIRKAQRDEEPGFFGSLFGSSPPPPRTPRDFVRLPKPEF